MFFIGLVIIAAILTLILLSVLDRNYTNKENKPRTLIPSVFTNPIKSPDLTSSATNSATNIIGDVQADFQLDTELNAEDVNKIPQKPKTSPVIAKKIPAKPIAAKTKKPATKKSAVKKPNPKKG